MHVKSVSPGVKSGASENAGQTENTKRLQWLAAVRSHHAGIPLFRAFLELGDGRRDCCAECCWRRGEPGLNLLQWLEVIPFSIPRQVAALAPVHLDVQCARVSTAARPAHGFEVRRPFRRRPRRVESWATAGAASRAQVASGLAGVGDAGQAPSSRCVRHRNCGGAARARRRRRSGALHGPLRADHGAGLFRRRHGAAGGVHAFRATASSAAQLLARLRPRQRARRSRAAALRPRRHRLPQDAGEVHGAVPRAAAVVPLHRRRLCRAGRHGGVRQ